MTTDLGGASAAGHGETWDGSGGDLSRMRRSEFLSDLLVGYLPRFPTRDALPTADATQWKRVVIVSTGAVPDVFYVCLITGIGPTVYSWVDLSTAYVPPAPPPEGLILVGSADTESSAITSTSAVTALTVSGLNIPTGKYVGIDLEFRKTTGAAASLSVGFSVNAAAVQIPVLVTGATNAADSGLMHARLGPREANYLVAGRFDASSQTLGTTGIYGASIGPTTMPAAVITSISIQALVSSASISGFIKNVRIYTYP